MKAIIIVMLAVQVLALVVTAIAVLTGRSVVGRRPAWSVCTIALVIISGASWNIANAHAREPGADVLMYGSPFLLGMGVMACLLLLRRLRGLDRLD
jgi:hypothetical protein